MNKRIKAVFVELPTINEDDEHNLRLISRYTNIAIVLLSGVNNLEGDKELIYLSEYPGLSLDKTGLMNLLHLKSQQVLLISTSRKLKKILSYVRIGEERVYNYRVITYRTLLSKANDKAIFSPSDFLKQANIVVSFSKDNFPHLENIYRLFRQSKKQHISTITTRKQLIDLLENTDMESFSVFAKSRYGNYGLIAFVSCEINSRIVREFVVDDFHTELEIENTIIRELNLSIPKEYSEKFNCFFDYPVIPYEPSVVDDILFKGPCDVRSIWEQFSDLCTETEFTYTNRKGISIESVNHYMQVIEALDMDDATVQYILSEIPFIDDKTLSKKIISKEYNTIITSVLTDANLGVYEKNDRSYRIVFGEKKHKILPQTIKKWLSGEYAASKYSFTSSYLEWFVKNFHYYGATNPRQLTKFVRILLDKLPSKTNFIVIGGVERKYKKCKNDNYIGRYLLHKSYRRILERNFKSVPNFKLISINDYIFDQSDFAGHYNHFARHVYYNLAIDLVSYIDSDEEKKYSIKLY